MDISNAQNKFQQILNDLNENDKVTFLKWIDKNWNFGNKPGSCLLSVYI